ncbi:hypothetical protein EYF80_031682 [Liparis tanakae]|uniref:Uncharacterized protein n=1 Tax=Liparis tanakae TaxID=230148 RepID=A0A4Z2GZ75_9TELE|nr:hypothetical protein EYF80_031682 [Liparis tanakae]
MRGDEILQGSAHVAELGHGAAPQHGALQLLSLHLLLLLQDLLLQASAVVLQLHQPPLQLLYLLLHRLMWFELTCVIVVMQNGFLLQPLQLQHHGLNLKGRHGCPSLGQRRAWRSRSQR